MNLLMDLKFTFKIILNIWVLTLLTSCSLLSKMNEGAATSHHQKLVVDATWVQDTLAQKNMFFRKVNRMSPIIYKNSIIAGNSYDGLVTFDLQSKSEKWRTAIPYGVEAGAATINDRLFVGSNSGQMYSIDMASGEIIWVFDSKSELVSEPLLHNGILYFISGSQSLYALDASNGKQIWFYNRQDTTSSMSIRGGSKPTIANGVLYVGFSDGALVAINAQTGTEQWEITLNRNTKFKDIDASPLVDGDYIYINSYDDKIYCLSKDKGEIIWSAAFGGFSTPLLLDGALIVTSSKGELAALSKKDGQVLWVKKTNNGVFIEPSLFKSMIMTGESQGKLLFFDQKTGNQVGSFEPGRGVFSKPSVHNDFLYFISGEGNIYGLKAQFESKSSIYYLR